MTTSIEWTRNPDGTAGQTWNPTVGCSKTSPGCTACYAIGVAHRAMQPAHEGLTVMTAGGVDWTGEVRVLPDRLDTPVKRKKPTTWFVDSMSDLFYDDVPVDFIAQVFDTMARCPQHTFIILTKRSKRMARVMNELADSGRGPLPNVHLGVSIELDRYSFRADHLRLAPAVVRILSCEPLLGALPTLDLRGIGQVIAGGESGPKARPMHPDWARDLRDRCAKARIPFFLKQWGEWEPIASVYTHGDPFAHEDAVDAAMESNHRVVALCSSGHIAQEFGPGPTGKVFTDHQPCHGAWWMRKVGKKAAGRTLDGVVWDELPERVVA